ncbi:hypothetical protein [Ichthyenterobacterium magnum]|uniref:Lipocalin-like protein n=1 Tax=Ichthyenterobacterium magnum TaxID=1230530 RepID=A0A420DGG0_9FLAO|nr:hypothetical protein [Ichthyenterobacterium magnum]RKE92174.1 hypothetical protein BXY80_2090 [Ichthyenterobacterium magnum]
MKLKYILVSFLVITLTTSCNSKRIQHSKTKQLDKRLLGSWKGFEENQIIEGVQSTWIQHRFDDGKFILLAVYNGDCDIETGAEKGEWWIENNLFYELHYSSGLTDIYEYKVLDENTVRFTAKKMSFKTNAKVYQFTDSRLKE